MKKKVKEFFENLVWNVKAFLSQPIVHKKTIDWVIAQNGSYEGSDNKYAFYWIGNFKDGYTVKVNRKENDAFVAAYKSTFEEEN